MSRIPKRAKQVLLSLTVTVLLLLGLELGFRQLRLTLDPNARNIMPREGEGLCYRPSLTLGYQPIPNMCQFNEQGFEAPGHKLDKAPGTFRVLVLGDSLSAGQAWVKEAEKRLSAMVPGRRIEFWNGGIPGFDTCTELRALQELGWDIDPDLVLLQFCVNDFTVTATIIPRADGRVRYFVGSQGHDLPTWALRSHLLTWLVVRYQLSRAAKIDRIRHNEKYVDRCLRLFSRRTAERKVPLSLVIFPALVSGEGTARDRRVVGPFRHWEKLARQMALRHDIDTLYLRHELELAGPLERLRFFPNDPWHPNEKGNLVAGKRIAEHLRQKYFAPGTSAIRSPSAAEKK